MKLSRLVIACAIAAALSSGAGAAGIPRSARLVKDAGNQFLSAKKYADAIDCYFQAIELYPEFAEAHYNLGVAFLKGYQAVNLSFHHFRTYLELDPYAGDRESVEALLEALAERMEARPKGRGEVIRVIAGRLLVSGGDWVQPGQEIEVAEKGETPCACLLASYVYPDSVLTQRIWNEDTLERMRPGLVAVNASDRLHPY